MKHPKEEEDSNLFGLMRGEPFGVRVYFTSKVAVYVAERTCSDDQVLEDQGDGGVILDFTATSEPEVISWVLSFGTEARLIEPEKLRNVISTAIGEMGEMYQ